MSLSVTEKSDTLTSKTIGRILEYIKEERLSAGNQLPTESELLKILGVSRIVLREALSYLKGLGLITSRRGSGFKIAQVDFAGAMRQALEHISILSSNSLDELMELRSQLEIGSVYEAVNNASQSDIDDIFLVLKKFEDCIQTGELDLEEYQSLELEFHQAIMTSAASNTLNIINGAIRSYFTASIRQKKQYALYHNPELASREFIEHRMIAEAFALHWPEVAETCLRLHLYKNRPRNLS
ncbi:MAG: hypothetical protein A2020_01880 [Lentisphaerae bacterium GWF2_45_14]|nr:MAG: hypothetical protein A2020_01880 [Lentisphaerae bacterium GWF2_45_14]